MSGPAADDTAIEDFETWHQAICRDFSLARFVGDVPSRLLTRLSVSFLGGFAHGHSTLSTDVDLNASREAIDVRRDPRDPFSVMLVHDGEVTIQQDDRVVRGAAGDLFMYDHGRPFRVTLHGSHRVSTLCIPRPLLDLRLTNPSKLTARALAKSSPAGAFAIAMIGQLGQVAPFLDPAAKERLSASVLDVLAVGFDGGAPDGRPSLGRRLSVEAKDYMRAHLDDPNLSIDLITKSLGIPARTLNRLFAAEGTTPMRWLLRLRLATSRNALADGRVSSVTEAAFSCGFNDLAHFSRSFKNAFGRTASSVRNSS